MEQDHNRTVALSAYGVLGSVAVTALSFGVKATEAISGAGHEATDQLSTAGLYVGIGLTSVAGTVYYVASRNKR